MKPVNNIEKLWQPARHIRHANVLRKLLFAYVIFNFLQLLPHIKELYGTESLILSWKLNGFTIFSLVNLLSFEDLNSWYILFFAVQIIFSVIGIIGILPRVSTFFVFLATINLQNRIYSTVSGGDILLCIMLFYLIFISGGKKLKNKNLDDIQNSFDTVFIWLCRFQLILVYAVSAIFKLQSAEWINGTAMQQILLINEYSLPVLKNWVCAAPFLFKILTWLGLLYQILFPFLIFIKRTKNYLIITGILFHLFIAFGMGLFNFSLVIICCYVLFYDFKERASKGSLILS